MKTLLLILALAACFYPYNHGGDYYGSLVGGLKFRYDEALRSRTLQSRDSWDAKQEKPHTITPDQQTLNNITSDPAFYMKLARQEREYDVLAQRAAVKHHWRE